MLVDGIPAHARGWDVDIPGIDSYYWDYVPNNGNLGLSVRIDKNQNLYLRVKKISAQIWSEYVVSNQLLQDTMYASISDFKIFNPFTTIELDRLTPSNLLNLDMAELTPDLQYFTFLKTTRFTIPATADHPGFRLPPGHFLPAAFR